MTKIDTAIIPVAGLGTRMLPATKEQPKEMLPVPVRDPKYGLVFKPFLQLVFEQLYLAGIRRFIFVVGRGKRIIEDYFTPDWSYAQYLRRRGKHREAAILEDLYHRIEESMLIWVNQPEPRGFGDAVLRGAQATPTDTFIVHAGDIAILDNSAPKNNTLVELIETYLNRRPTALILTRRVPDPQHYGVAITEPLAPPRLHRVVKVLEKPRNPPTNQAITAIYVFERKIIDALKDLSPRDSGEVELTDAIQHLIDQNQRVEALEARSNEEFIDIGRPEAYIKAIMTLASST